MSFKRLSLIVAALLLVTAALFLYSRLHPSGGPPKLSITSLGMRMDPLTHVTGFTVNGRGATGLCAMFAVTNASKESEIWFETVAVERKIDTGWQRIPTDLDRAPPVPKKLIWSGIDSDGANGLWPAGHGCLFAIGWPPNLPTNDVWRIEIKCGRGPSKLAQFLSDKFDLEFFTKRSPEQIILTPEVHCTP